MQALDVPDVYNLVDMYLLPLETQNSLLNCDLFPVDFKGSRDT